MSNMVQTRSGLAIIYNTTQNKAFPSIYKLAAKSKEDNLTSHKVDSLSACPFFLASLYSCAKFHLNCLNIQTALYQQRAGIGSFRHNEEHQRRTSTKNINDLLCTSRTVADSTRLHIYMAGKGQHAQNLKQASNEWDGSPRQDYGLRSIKL